MNMANAALKLTASMTRRLPYIRGMGRACHFINSTALKAGATPVAEAKLQGGAKALVDLRARSQCLTYYLGAYERRLTSILLAMADQSKPFVDVGANIGLFSMPLGVSRRALAGAAPVVAFEPVEVNASRLSQNIQLNDVESICQLHRYGLSDREGGGLATLRQDFKGGAQTGNAALEINPKLDEGFERTSVRLRRLDDVWPELGLGEIDIIKVDVEGHEDHVFRGGRETIFAHRPVILMEVSHGYYRARGLTVDEAFEGVLPEDYRIFYFHKRRWIEIPTPGATGKFENVFLIPQERLNDRVFPYSLFGR